MVCKGLLTAEHGGGVVIVETLECVDKGGALEDIVGMREAEDLHEHVYVLRFPHLLLDDPEVGAHVTEYARHFASRDAIRRQVRGPVGAIEEVSQHVFDGPVENLLGAERVLRHETVEKTWVLCLKFLHPIFSLFVAHVQGESPLRFRAALYQEHCQRTANVVGVVKNNVEQPE